MKKRIALVAFLSAIVATCCALVLAGCGSKAEKRQITWTYDNTLVTVVADGYKELPSELAEGTEVKFTAQPINGYSVSVSGASKDGDGYKLTVGTKDASVKITATKTLNSISVVLKDENKVYFEDQTVDKADLTVTAKYALGDEVVTDYTINYAKESAFADGDTTFEVSFGGKSETVTLKNAVKATLTFEEATLSVNGDNQPVLTVKGFYNQDGDEATIKAAVGAFINNCTERGTWASIGFTSEATVAADKSFVLTITITGAIKDGGQYYFHVKSGQDGMDLTAPLTNESFAAGPSNDTITAEYTGDPVDGTDGSKFYVGYCENWGSHPIMITMVNPDAARFVNVSLVEDGGKPYVVFNGTGVITEAALLKMINHLDLEDIKNGNAKLADYIAEPAEDAEEGATSTLNSEMAKIEINTDAKTFKVICLLEGEAIQDGSAFMGHLGAKGSDGYYPNVSYAGDTENATITVGGFKYSFATAADLSLGETWQANLLYIKVEAV